MYNALYQRAKASVTSTLKHATKDRKQVPWARPGDVHFAAVADRQCSCGRRDCAVLLAAEAVARQALNLPPRVLDWPMLLRLRRRQSPAEADIDMEVPGRGVARSAASARNSVADAPESLTMGGDAAASSPVAPFGSALLLNSAKEGTAGYSSTAAARPVEDSHAGAPAPLPAAGIVAPSAQQLLGGDVRCILARRRRQAVQRTAEDGSTAGYGGVNGGAGVASTTVDHNRDGRASASATGSVAATAASSAPGETLPSETRKTAIARGRPVHPLPRWGQVLAEDKIEQRIVLCEGGRMLPVRQPAAQPLDLPKGLKAVAVVSVHQLVMLLDSQPALIHQLVEEIKARGSGTTLIPLRLPSVPLPPGGAGAVAIERAPQQRGEPPGATAAGVRAAEVAGSVP